MSKVGLNLSPWGQRVQASLAGLEPKSFGRVGVLLGGKSGEREISLMSGNGVLEALRSKGVDAHAFDTGLRCPTELAKENFDRVFISLPATNAAPPLENCTNTADLTLAAASKTALIESVLITFTAGKANLFALQISNIFCTSAPVTTPGFTTSKIFCDILRRHLI